MSSFKILIKDWVMNVVFPLLPPAFICWYFDFLMLPKADSDIQAVRGRYIQKILSDSDLLGSLSAPHGTKVPVVIGMVGLPQSGKTSVAETLMISLGIAHIDSNLIRGWLIDSDRDYSNINTIAFFFMNNVLEGRGSVIMDSDNMLPGKRALLEALAKRHGANFEYVRVDTDPRVLKRRLSSPGHTIHRMYSDGVRRSNPLYKDSNVSIPRQMIIDCVVGEWVRQQPGHYKYMNALSSFGFLSNDGTKSELEEEVREVGKKLLYHYGEIK
jgi:hypothetical protein